MKMIAEYILMFMSFSQFSRTGSYYAPFLLVLVLGCTAAWVLPGIEKQSGSTRRLQLDGRNRRGIWMMTVLFVFFCTASNYELWLDAQLGGNAPTIMQTAYSVVLFLVLAVGSGIAFFDIFTLITLESERFIWTPAADPWPHRRVFWAAFGSIAFVDLFVLLFLKYPGVMTGDSIVQLRQVLTGEYTNLHPVFHTMTIAAFVRAGLALGGDVNVGIAMYHAFQAVFMAAVFAFSVMTIAELRAPRWLVLAAGIFYTVAPYHIAYSMHMWKDVMFAGWLTLFCLITFRMVRKKCPSIPDWLIFVMSIVGSCLFRPNGLLVIGISCIAFVILFRKSGKRMAVVLLLTLLCCSIIMYPVVSAMQIEQSDLVQSMSMPTQQIARAVVDHHDLTEEEYDFLNQIMTVEAIDEQYNPELSDFIKDLTRRTGGEAIIRSQPWRFLKLYFSLGLRHPDSYLKAWIDQTRGYWGSGYRFYIWCDNVFDNDLGAYNTIRSPFLSSLYDHYLGAFSHFTFLQLLISLGFCTWLCIVCLYMAWIHADRAGMFVSLPVIAVFGTLLMGTPVASEFRYLYSAFCMIPFSLTVAAAPQACRAGTVFDSST